MGAYRTANPADAYNFDFESYEAGVEEGRRHLVIAMLVSIVIVVCNLVVGMWMFDAYLDFLPTLPTLNPELAQNPQFMVALEQVLEATQASGLQMQFLAANFFFYAIITIVPWALIYFGNSMMKTLVIVFTGLSAVFGLLSGIGFLLMPQFLWVGVYTIVISLVKFYPVAMLVSSKSIKKYLNHMTM